MFIIFAHFATDNGRQTTQRPRPQNITNTDREKLATQIKQVSTNETMLLLTLQFDFSLSNTIESLKCVIFFVRRETERESTHETTTTKNSILFYSIFICAFAERRIFQLQWHNKKSKCVAPAGRLIRFHTMIGVDAAAVDAAADAACNFISSNVRISICILNARKQTDVPANKTTATPATPGTKPVKNMNE